MDFASTVWTFLPDSINRGKTATAGQFLPFPIHLLATDGARLPACLYRVSAALTFFLEYMFTEGTDSEVQVNHTLTVLAELLFALF